MNGGQTIVTGIILVLISLYLMSFQGTFGPMMTCLGGAIPLALVGAGAVMLTFGITDWRNARTQGSQPAAPSDGQADAG